MGLEYLNRCGDRYYVLQGTTKTGKPKYYCARKAQGVSVDELPAEFEIHESPMSGLVSIRKVKPSRILPQEREFLDQMARKLAGIEHFIIDAQGDSLVVFLCDENPNESVSTLEMLVGPLGRHAKPQTNWIMRKANYSPMFRFTLCDEGERLFSIDRWCYLGSIDKWIFLGGAQPLDVLAKKYLPQLGKESFYELM